MRCDMCGSAGQLYVTIIEAAHLKVCHECSRLGKVLHVAKESSPSQAARSIPITEVVEMVRSNCGSEIQRARQGKGFTQAEFAKSLNEKESVIHNVEANKLTPPLGLAKKIERALHIKITQMYEESHETVEAAASGPMTIGDMIKIKKR